MFRSRVEARKIPSNWEFNGRNKPGFSPTALSLDTRFLAFRLPPFPDIDDRRYRGEYSELFFNPDGHVTDYRRHSAWSTDVRVGEVDFHLHQWRGRHLRGSSLEVRFRPENPSDLETDANSVAAMRYEGGILQTVALGQVFHNTDGDRTSPLIIFHRDSDGNFSQIGPPLPSDSRFSVTCEPQGGFVRVEQTDRDTNTNVTKVVTVPQQVDMDKIVKAAYAEVTQQRRFRELSEPLWREMPTLVGASVTYTSGQQANSF